MASRTDTNTKLRDTRNRISRYMNSSRQDTGDTLAKIQELIQSRERMRYPDLSQYTHQATMYARSTWVYVAVQRIARAAALIDLTVQHLSGEDTQDIANHPFELLLKRPNNYCSQFEFIEQTVGNLLINGNSYWFMHGGAENTPPQELYTLRPDRVRIVAGKSADQFVGGYIYTVDGVEVPIEPWEVCHYKRFHPLSDFYGLSPLEALAVDVQTDLKMKEWNRKFYGEDQAVPAGIVNIKAPVTLDEFEKIKSEWMRLYGGTQRRTAFLRAAELAYQDIGANHRDMDFISGMEFSKDQILLAYGIPPGMLDKNATEANATAGLELFITGTVWPIMIELCSKMTSYILPRYGDNLVCEPEDIRSKDTSLEAFEVNNYGPYLTFNEGRARFLEMEPIDEEWANVPVGVIPMLMRATGGTAALTPEQAQGATYGGPGYAALPQPTTPQLGAGQPQPFATAYSAPPTKAMLPPPVVLSPLAKREIEQYVAYASKRMGDRRAELARFEFRHTPRPVAYAIRCVVEASTSDPACLQWLGAYKILEAGERVGMDGTLDPFATERTKTARGLARALTIYLSFVRDGTAQSIAASLPFDTLATRLPSYVLQEAAKALDEAANKTLDVLAMQTGIEAAYRVLDDDPIKTWQDYDLAGFAVDSTAIEPLLTGLPDKADRLSAVLASPLYAASRAEQFAEATAAYLYDVGTWQGTKAIADALAVPMLVSLDRVAQSASRNLFITPSIVQDTDGNVTACSVVWHTVGKAVDEPYHKVRGMPLHGKEALAVRPFGKEEIARYFDEYAHLTS